MQNVIKPFLFLAIGFALGAFTMKHMGQEEMVSDTGFKPIAMEKSATTSQPASAPNSNNNGFTPFQKEESSTTGFKPIQSSPREQALLQENQQLKQRIQYLEAQLKR